MTVCACMGPQGKDPVCPCRMRAMGKVPTGWSEDDRYRLTEVLKDIFDMPKTDPWDEWKPNKDIE